jgi:hypothetical protein
MPGYTAQCIAADDTIAGTLGQSGVSVRNFVWEASNRAFPVMLPLEPGWVVDGVYDVMVTASGMVAGSNGTTFKKWTRGIGGVWGAPDVRALGTATFVGMTYHGQILRNASGIGVEIIDSGVTAGAWPSFAVPALPSPASNLAYGTNYCAEGYLLTSTPIIRVPVIVN